MSHPICPNCRQTIYPGTPVNVITDPDVDPPEGEGLHAYAKNETIVTHAECPEPVTLRKISEAIAQLPDAALDLPLLASTTLTESMAEMDPDDEEAADARIAVQMSEKLARWITAIDDYIAGTPVGVQLWPDKDNPKFAVLVLNEGTPTGAQTEIDRIEREGGGK